MISINRLDHIGVRVSDFKYAETFYRQFGFRVTRRDPEEGVVVLRHHSGLELNLLDSVSRQQQAENILMDIDTKWPGYTHIALQVLDIAKAVNHLTALGIEITEGSVTFGDGKTSIFFRDPDRNVIELTSLPFAENTQQEVKR